MKNQIVYPIILILIICCSCQNEVDTEDLGIEMGQLHVSKMKPKPGETLLFRYTPPSQTNVVPEAIIDLRTGEGSYPIDVELKDSAGIWKGKIQIPDSSHAVAFNFKNGDLYDNNNNKGYILPLYPMKMS